MSDTSKVLAAKFTDDRLPIEWKDEAEEIRRIIDQA